MIMSSKSSTLLFLTFLILFALAIALAARSNKVIPIGPQPSPAVSAKKGS